MRSATTTITRQLVTSRYIVSKSCVRTMENLRTANGVKYGLTNRLVARLKTSVQTAGFIPILNTRFTHYYPQLNSVITSINPMFPLFYTGFITKTTKYIK